MRDLIVAFCIGCIVGLSVGHLKASELQFSGDSISFTKEGCLILVPDVRALHEHVLLGSTPDSYEWSIKNSDPLLTRFFVLAGQISIRNKHMNPVDFSNNFYENCMTGLAFRLLPEA